MWQGELMCSCSWKNPSDVRGYKQRNTAMPHSCCILITGKLFVLNCHGSWRNGTHPDAESLFFALPLGRGCPAVTGAHPHWVSHTRFWHRILGKWSYPVEDAAVTPKASQSIHFLLSEQKAKSLSQNLDQVSAANTPYCSPRWAGLGHGTGCWQQSCTSQSCSSSRQFSWHKPASASSQHGKAVFTQTGG